MLMKKTLSIDYNSYYNSFLDPFSNQKFPLFSPAPTISRQFLA